MKRFISLVALVGLFAFSGCALLLIGGAGAGGYALTKDSAEGILDHSYDKVWSAATQVMSQDGIVRLQDKNHGRIEAEVSGITMKTQVDRVGDKATRLRIEARKNLLPKAKQAEEEFIKIINRLK